VIITEPEHAEDVLHKHAKRVSRHENQEPRLERARPDQKRAPQAAIADGEDAAAPMSLLAILENKIEAATCQAAAVDPSIKSNETEKTEHDNAWRTCCKLNSRLETQRGQAFSMIRGQCMQVLPSRQDETPRPLDNGW
jgi:hypothetical protein